MELNDIIRQAQRISGAPRNVTAVVKQMLHGKLWDALMADPVAHRIVMRAGLDLKVGALIKHMRNVIEERDGVAGLTKDQLDLWPEAVRGLVKRGDRAALYVPSAGEYVDVLPDILTPAQSIEGGRALVAHGRDSIRRGKIFIQLGETGW